MRSYHRSQVACVAVLGLLCVLGCGRSGPKFHAVTGQVRPASGDPASLAGSYVEAALESDPTVRATAEIGPDGSFTLESLHAGAILRGAREGSYKVRVILTDEDAASRRAAARAVAPRYLKFETSGLTLQVPASGDVQLSVSAK